MGLSLTRFWEHGQPPDDDFARYGVEVGECDHCPGMVAQHKDGRAACLRCWCQRFTSGQEMHCAARKGTA